MEKVSTIQLKWKLNRCKCKLFSVFITFYNLLDMKIFSICGIITEPNSRLGAVSRKFISLTRIRISFRQNQELKPASA